MGFVDLKSLLESPWLFTQSHPLSTGDVRKQLAVRGVSVDSMGLRELHRQGLLSPFIELNARRVGADISMPDEPHVSSSTLAYLRIHAERGRVRSPQIDGFRRWTPFEENRIDHPRNWSNGLLYSRWQMLASAWLGEVVRVWNVWRAQGRRRLPLPPSAAFEGCQRVASIAWLLTALEARYFPTLHPEQGEVHGDWDDVWGSSYQPTFNAPAEAARLKVDVPGLLEDAEYLLWRAGKMDPLGEWSSLVRRAPVHRWKSLTGDALIAIELRAAAEILLSFYEDVTGSAPSIRNERERLSFRTEKYLDRDLARFSISPHPGAVILTEGETEQFMFQQVLVELGYRLEPDLLHVVCVGGADRDLTVLVPALAAPIVGDRHGADYELIRPPTRVVITSDPEGSWGTEAKREKQERKLISSLAKVIEMQGVEVADGELEHLLTVHVWQGGCFEFSHFADDELSEAIVRVMGDDLEVGQIDLVDALRRCRENRWDIKRVWSQWATRPNKLELAKCLWPFLEKRIKQASAGEIDSWPEIATVAAQAAFIAVGHSRGPFIIRGTS